MPPAEMLGSPTKFQVRSAPELPSHCVKKSLENPPHLMLSHAGGDYRLILDIRSEIGKLCDDTLWLYQAIFGLLLVGKRQTFLPVVDLGEPFRTRTFLVYEWKETC